MIANETLKTIKQRRSIRSFQAEQIKEEELQAVLEAGLYAPNAGDQSWHFTVVQNRALLDRLNLAAKEAARQMPIEPLRQLGSDDNFNCLYGAPTLIIVSGSERAPMPLDADCAAATQNLLLAAESIGWGRAGSSSSCWLSTPPKAPRCARNLKFPKLTSLTIRLCLDISRMQLSGRLKGSRTSLRISGDLQ